MRLTTLFILLSLFAIGQSKKKLYLGTTEMEMRAPYYLDTYRYGYKERVLMWYSVYPGKSVFMSLQGLYDRENLKSMFAWGPNKQTTWGSASFLPLGKPKSWGKKKVPYRKRYLPKNIWSEPVPNWDKHLPFIIGDTSGSAIVGSRITTNQLVIYDYKAYDTISCFLLVSDTSINAGLINPVLKQVKGYYIWYNNEWQQGIAGYLDENKKPLPKWMAVWMKLN